MGKFNIFSILLVTMFVLIACGDSSESTNEREQDSNTSTEGVGSTETTETDESTKKELTHNYPYFDLKVEYPSGKYVTVYYDFNGDIANTKFESTAKNPTELSGEEAYAKIESEFEKLTFDSSSSQVVVVLDIVKNIGLYSDYKKLDLKVKFADGTENEFLVEK